MKIVAFLIEHPSQESALHYGKGTVAHEIRLPDELDEEVLQQCLRAYGERLARYFDTGEI